MSKSKQPEPTFHLARYVSAPLLSERMMHFGVREIVASISAAALIFCCSCVKHRVGEDPEVQREKEGNVAAESKSAVTETPAAKRTPAEFFPGQSPSPTP